MIFMKRQKNKNAHYKVVIGLACVGLRFVKKDGHFCYIKTCICVEFEWFDGLLKFWDNKLVDFAPIIQLKRGLRTCFLFRYDSSPCFFIWPGNLPNICNS